MNESSDPQFITVEGVKIAVCCRHGCNRPGLFWLGGYRSEMAGTKAVAVDALAGRLGLPALRHDYSGHGLSQGNFFQGTISLWLRQSLAVFDRFATGPQILIGSSMGGWMALRMAGELKKRHIRLAGIVLIAPAPDFTRTLVESGLTEEQKHALETKGFFEIRSESGTMPYTKMLIDDGRNNLVMEGLIEPGCPVHILQGMQDEVVPYQHTLKLMEHLPLGDVTLTLFRDGDHRLSRSQDILLLERTVETLIAAG